MMRVGFIGLGDQGGPMARRIVDAGYPLTIWARRAETIDPFRSTAAVVAASPMAVAATSDIVCLCVVDDDGIAAVLEGEQGVLAGLAPGSVVVVHSTVHPETCRRFAATAARRGSDLVDAPVSGGGAAASDSRLLVMVGGSAVSVERCRPVFETYGDPVVHLGPVGSGQLTKLINNLLFTAHLGTAGGAFALAEEMGIERGPLADVLAHGSGASFALAGLAQMGYSPSGLPARVADLLRKDVRLLEENASGLPSAGSMVLTTALDAIRQMPHG